MTKKELSPLRVAIHLYAWSALARLIFDFFAQRLSPNVIQDLEQRTGRHALALLILSLACAPLNSVFGWREPLKRRRALGLYAFAYASVHALIFVDLDNGLAWSLFAKNVLQKPYVLVGMTSFLLLLPLALTSFDVWKQRLGKNWKRLHRLVYFIAPLVILHYAWSKKGDFFNLQGDILKPLAFGVVLIVLLALRTPLWKYITARLKPPQRSS
jgi:sulfoxide reductase heme-binding subunit YedZ